MTYKIALNFEDGVTRFIACLPGEKLADAAYRLGINIPLDCREGACGTCKSYCESGIYTMSDFVDDALTEDEASKRFVLTCRMQPTSDCVVRISAKSTACLKSPPQEFESRILDVRELSSSTLLLRLQCEDSKGLDFLPGQYANLRIPGSDDVRAFSFSSLATPNGPVEFLIRRVPDGRMSNHLTRTAKKDDVIKFRAPFGSFYLRPIVRPTLMLAGGTGLAPFLSMLEWICKNGSDFSIRLVYGVTRDEDLVCIDALDRFQRDIPNFSYTACIAQSTSGYMNRGFVTDHLSSADYHDGDVDIYLCGPPPMVEAVEKALAIQNIVPASLHYEKFLASR